MSFIDLLGKRNPGEGMNRFLAEAEAAGRVESRLEARRKAAATQPKGTVLLGEGSAETVLELMKYYQRPVYLPGGLTGVRLHFARMSDEDRMWIAVGGATLYQCGEQFVLQPVDPATPQLRLTLDDHTFRRVSGSSSSGRVAEPRNPGQRGMRLG